MKPTLLLLAAMCAWAQAPELLSPDAAGVFPIWPGTAPGSESWTWREQTEMRGGNRMARNIVAPTLTMYKPAGKANGTSVIIAPGGAFRFLMVDYEGVDVARWLAARGVTAFVLKYRTLHTPEGEREMTAYLAAMMKELAASDTKGENPPNYSEASKQGLALGEEDGRQAIRYVRAHAAEWGLDAHRIGIMGFSAGGGVTMGPVMQHDAASRPDFAAPIYPAYRAATPVPTDAPPLFIAFADDDQLISPGSGARLYAAWHAAGKPAALHIYSKGGHGFGAKKQNLPSDVWMDQFHEWLTSLKLVPAAFNQMFVFGDSYSDMGAGYVDGNGPTAVGYLAERLGIKLETPQTGGARSINFAVSGAQTGKGDGRRVKDALLGYGMVNQVDEFDKRVEAKTLAFDAANTLFFIAGGLNDRKLESAVTVANLKDHVRKLYAHGARRFRLALLPAAVPSFREVADRLNPEISRIPRELEGELPGAEVRLSNWGPYFDEVMRDAASLGFTNTKDACAGRAIFDQDATPCATPNAYYFYHAGHPSAAVHKLVGAKLYAEVTGH